MIFEHQFIPEPNSGCWLWTGCLTNSGYGQLRLNGGPVLGHRLSWETHRGPIPEGAYVLHHCDVRCCINPDHLFLGDAAANFADMAAKGRFTPPRGERQGSSKLTADKVIAIRADPRSYSQIGAEYGISTGMVTMLKQRKRWRHIL